MGYKITSKDKLFAKVIYNLWNTKWLQKVDFQDITIINTRGFEKSAS